MTQLRDIPGFEGRYGITRNGEVYSYRKDQWMKIQYTKTQHQAKLVLTNDHKKVTRTIARMIGETWIPNPRNLPYVCHRKLTTPMIDKVSNLFWGTAHDYTKAMHDQNRWSYK